MPKKKEELDSLAHTRWNCKYHIVFAIVFKEYVKFLIGRDGEFDQLVASTVRRYKRVRIMQTYDIKLNVIK